MSNLLLIPDIHPGMLRWTCKVMVIEKQNARSSKTTPTKLYRPMTLQDVAGNKVQAMTYNDQIDLFCQKMELYGTYLISGAVVKPARDVGRVPDINYTNVWTLTRSTFIQDVQPGDAIARDDAPTYELTQIRDIYEFVGGNKLISVIAVVIQRLPREWITIKDKQIRATELVVVDEGSVPVVLTLWETFSLNQGTEIEYDLRRGNFPTVLIKNIGCTLFQGLKLGTKFSSTLELHPGGDRALSLEQWKLSHAHAISCMIRDKSHLDSLIQIAEPLSKTHLKVSDLCHIYNQDKLIWLKGNVSLPPYDAVSSFVGCNFCAGRVNTEAGQTLNCLSLA